MHTGHLLPPLLAAVAAWLIGALWYSPLLFAKAWVKAHGYTPEQVKAMQASAGKAYAGSLLAMVLMALVLQLFFSHLGVDSVSDGVTWGFHAWLGFALPLGFIASLYSDKRMSVFVIDSGYQLVYIVTMGAILGHMH